MCISYRRIIKRDIRYNYKCSPVLIQTLADCDAIASSRCQGFIIENGNLCEEWKYELWARAGRFENRLLALPIMSKSP